MAKLYASSTTQVDAARMKKDSLGDSNSDIHVLPGHSDLSFFLLNFVFDSQGSIFVEQTYIFKEFCYKIIHSK